MAPAAEEARPSGSWDAQCKTRRAEAVGVTEARAIRTRRGVVQRELNHPRILRSGSTVRNNLRQIGVTTCCMDYIDYQCRAEKHVIYATARDGSVTQWVIYGAQNASLSINPNPFATDRQPNNRHSNQLTPLQPDFKNRPSLCTIAPRSIQLKIFELPYTLQYL
jgi:hypothetical protein